MTSDEYRGLVEILGRIEAKVTAHDARFEAIDQRFDATDRRFDVRLDETRDTLRGEIATLRRESGVIAEGLRGEIRLVAEGVVTVDVKLDRFRGEVARGLEDLRADLRRVHGDLDRRVRRLEEGR